MTDDSTALPRVLLAYPLPDPASEALLRRHAEIVTPSSTDAGGFATALRDVDAVVLQGPTKLTAALMDTAPRLRLIAAQGSGTDNIDIDAATERGIPVLSGAGVAASSVAEYALGAMVLVHRGGLALHRSVADGMTDWAGRLDALRGTQLTSTVLGIVGCGHIGRELARMASAAFDMQVVGYDPWVASDDAVGPVIRRYHDLDRLLEESLTVSVHVPLTADTRGLIGAEQLRRIGPTGVLIDTARGGVVDQEALVSALKNGEIKGAALDVFDPEPPDSDQMRRLAAVPNLLLSPHVAGVTDQALTRLSANVVNGIVAVFQGKPCTAIVNQSALDRTST